MSESKKLIPRRRFKEFEGAECWQSFELGKITNYIKGYAFNSCDYQSYGVRIIRVSDLSSDKIKNNNECIYIAVNKAKIYDKYSIQKFDIIITTVGSKSELKESAVGRPIMINESKDYLLNQNLVKISPQNNLSSYFLYCQLLQPKYTNYIAVIERGNANQANIALNDLWMYQCNIPSILEQDMLATFFKKLDNLINTQQKKLEKAKTLKSAYLTEMFPNEGELKPRLRFNGFSNNWESFPLEKIGSTYTGLSGKTKDDFGHGNAEFITYMNIFNNPIADLNRTEPVEIDDKQNQVMYGDVFFTTSSETPHEVGLSSIWLGDKKNVYLNSFCFGFRPNINIEPYYFAFMLRSPSMRKKLSLLAQGISRYNISKNRVMKLYIANPNTAEQTKIGNFFKLLDNKIALEQKKLDKLKHIKQAYLNEMFV
jgi:type I restriction enzyme, S subunit